MYHVSAQGVDERMINVRYIIIIIIKTGNMWCIIYSLSLFSHAYNNHLKQIIAEYTLCIIKLFCLCACTTSCTVIISAKPIVFLV